MSDQMVLTLGPSPGDDVYLSLGRTIAGLCPPGFDEAKLDAELEGEAGMRLACTPADGSEMAVAIDSAAEARIGELLGLIRDKTARDDGSRWHKCTVILRKGGQFQMDVQY